MNTSAEKKYSTKIFKELILSGDSKISKTDMARFNSLVGFKENILNWYISLDYEIVTVSHNANIVFADMPQFNLSSNGVTKEEAVENLQKLFKAHIGNMLGMNKPIQPPKHKSIVRSVSWSNKDHNRMLENMKRDGFENLSKYIVHKVNDIIIKKALHE
jgi:predicted RNase H-like HicB family nuclease